MKSCGGLTQATKKGASSYGDAPNRLGTVSATGGASGWELLKDALLAGLQQCLEEALLQA